jgi:hypothetical protein
MLNSANVRANNDYRRPTEPHRYLLCGAGRTWTRKTARLHRRHWRQLAEQIRELTR